MGLLHIEMEGPHEGHGFSNDINSDVDNILNVAGNNVSQRVYNKFHQVGPEGGSRSPGIRLDVTKSQQDVLIQI